MTEKEPDNHNNSDQQTQAATSQPVKKKSSRPLWIVSLIFFALVLIVFMTQQKGMINWVEDYQAGLKSAQQQNKPILLAFYKKFAPMITSTWQDTYADPKVIEYVEATFIPILIDVDKQPKIAELYKANYYPTHYVKHPHSDRMTGPLLGYDPPALFITKLKRILEELGPTDK